MSYFDDLESDFNGGKIAPSLTDEQIRERASTVNGGETGYEQKTCTKCGGHASGAEYEVSNLLGAYTLLENRINDIGDRHVEEDAKRAGFEYPAPKAPD